MKYLLPILALAAPLAFGAGAQLTCTAPTIRTDGTALGASEVASYTFYLGAASIGTNTICTYTYTPVAGACVKAGSVFGVTATDTGGLVSAMATATVAADICTPKALPAAPGTVKITVLP